MTYTFLQQPEHSVASSYTYQSDFVQKFTTLVNIKKIRQRTTSLGYKIQESYRILETITENHQASGMGGKSPIQPLLFAICKKTPSEPFTGRPKSDKLCS